MKTAQERKQESEKALKTLTGKEMQAIEQLMDRATAQGKMKINLKNYPSKEAVKILYDYGYHIADHSSQREGVDIDISWD